ncbi:arsenite methyltransferase [Candidatus Nitrosocosmicus franklandus]|nr:arsenite methyltransferase [Candidatus Nitrosocosmicus franklandus]
MSKQSQLKEKIKEQYEKIAIDGNTNSCCMPSNGCCNTSKVILTPFESSKAIGYDSDKLRTIPESSILGVGCGNPTRFGDVGEGDTVVDVGSGAGIDAFLAANVVGASGKVIGIDMTTAMLQKARENAEKHGYKNVEFREGDIERKIPVDNDSVDVVLSNCVINLTTNKENTFREIYRILKPHRKGRMVISDLITSKEMDPSEVNESNWCSCIDGALTKENYIQSIKNAGFDHIEILDKKPYMELDSEKKNQEKRLIRSISIRALKP